MSRYRCVDARKAEQFPVTAACAAAGVSASAYYAWVARREHGPSHAELAETDLVGEIRTIHADSGGVYGAPRVTAELHRHGWIVNRKRVERLMRSHGLIGWRPRRRRSLTRPDTSVPPAPDLLGRRFDPDQLNVAWCGDLTYIPTDEGWLYLASVLDLASRYLVGWSMGKAHDARLVTDALDAAVATRGRGRMDATIFHTDRGAEYSSAACADACAMRVRGSGCANPWGAPAPAWITPPPSRSSRPSKSSLSVDAAGARAPKPERRSSPGSPGTTAGGCTRPPATSHPWSGNSITPPSPR